MGYAKLGNIKIKAKQSFILPNQRAVFISQQDCQAVFGVLCRFNQRTYRKVYDYFMVDEIQDLGGHDFNLIQAITPTTIDCLFVGDFYQHTFDTSNDRNINKGLYNDYNKYKKKWSAIGVTIDETTLSNSYRCSPTTCQLVTQQLHIQISSHWQDNTKIILIDNQDDADTLFVDNEKVKLFYREANKYSCYAENWGKSKGLDKFQDVCIVLY